jgi:hypothetical protein
VDVETAFVMTWMLPESAWSMWANSMEIQPSSAAHMMTI